MKVKKNETSCRLLLGIHIRNAIAMTRTAYIGTIILQCLTEIEPEFSDTTTVYFKNTNLTDSGNDLTKGTLQTFTLQLWQIRKSYEHEPDRSHGPTAR